MGYDSFRKSVEQRLKDNWATTPIVFEDTTYRPSQNQAFVELKIIPGITQQVTVGATNNCFRSEDIIQVEINVPSGSGTITLSQYADSIISIFKGQAFDGITVRGFSGPDKFEVEGYTRWIISFYCWRDEI